MDVLPMRPRFGSTIINIAGLTALIVFTALLYLRTQEPVIILVGGLISVVSVIGATMTKTA